MTIVNDYDIIKEKLKKEDNIMYYKYPRTYHLPFSETITDDDKRLPNTKQFEQMQIVITEKMDGENTTIYHDYYHARSLDSKHKEYHSYLLSNILPKIQYLIPNDMHVCGEYLYAEHSIHYENLKDYFLMFSMWQNDICLSWKETKEWAELLGLPLVPELYIGSYDETIVKKMAREVVERGGEGIVIRNVESFHYDEFSKNVGKYVRANHVQTDTHWTNQEIRKNGLENKNNF